MPARNAGDDRVPHPLRENARAWIAQANDGEPEAAERRDGVEELENIGVSPRETRGEGHCADKPERGLPWQGALAAPDECDQRQRDKANPEREGDGADAVVKERIGGDAESEPGARHGKAEGGVEADTGRSDRTTRGALVSAAGW